MSQVMTGGWSNFNFELGADSRKLFDDCTSKLLGVQYRPIAYATQIVAGTNYSYLAEARVVAPQASTRAVKVHIFQPLPGQGESHITQIIDIVP